MFQPSGWWSNKVSPTKFFICPEWLDALAFSLLSVEKYTVGIGIGINIPEKCLAELLCIKGKKVHTCFYKRIIFFLAKDTQWADLILMSFNLSLSFVTLIFSKSAFHCLCLRLECFSYIFRELFFRGVLLFCKHPFVLFIYVGTFQESQSSYGFKYLQFLIRKPRVSK